MAEGGTGSIPRDFFRWPVNYSFYSGRLIPGHAGQLRAYLGAHAIRTALVADAAPGPWRQAFATLGGEPRRRGEGSSRSTGEAARRQRRPRIPTGISTRAR